MNTNHTKAPPPTPAQRRIALVIKAVAKHYDHTPSSLLAPGRWLKLVRPRQIAMFIARDLTGASYPTLAAEFGGRDHGTVMHACGAVEDLVAGDAQINLVVAMLRGQCRELLEKEGLT